MMVRYKTSKKVSFVVVFFVSRTPKYLNTTEVNVHLYVVQRLQRKKRTFKR